MLFGTILRKYTRRKEKSVLLKEMILGLKIDQIQKDLFIDSLEVLDDTTMDGLYEKILHFADQIEDKQIQDRFRLESSLTQKIGRSERKEKEKEQNSFNILLDSI